MPEEPSALDIAKGDVERNIRAFATISLYDASDIKKYLADTLWPTIESLLEAVTTEFELQGEAIDEIIEGEADTLHAELAELIVGAMTEGAELVAALVAKLPPADKSGPTMALRSRAAKFGGTVQEVIERVVEITIPDDAPDPADKDDEDEDDDEDEGDAPDGGPDARS